LTDTNERTHRIGDAVLKAKPPASAESTNPGQASMLMTSAAVAQTEGTPIDTPPVPPEKQAIVKEQARREKPSEAHLAGPVTVGMVFRTMSRCGPCRRIA
jgi:hypothetical protein